MIIPTISSPSIHDNDLEDLMQIGFCYVKLSDTQLMENIQTCMQVARTFFKSDIQEKSKWHVKDVLTSQDRYQGYILRSQSQNTNSIEQFFFEPDAAYGPYEAYSSYIEEINVSFRTTIFLPIINAIFKNCQIEEADFTEATSHPYLSLLFQIYPFVAKDRNVIRFNAHKDFGLLTVLFFEESGLEIKYQNTWHAIPAREDCVVVNLGNAIELMTGKRCHSALHRVVNATDDRISMVYFYNANYKQPVKNYIDNTIISQTGELFFKQQFADYFQVSH